MFDKIKNSLPMGVVKDDSFGITTNGKLAVKSKTGTYRYYDAKEEILVDAASLGVDVTDSCMVVPVLLAQLKEGDIITTDTKNIYYHFLGVNKNKKIQGINLKTGEKVTKVPISNLLLGGQVFVGKVISPLTMGADSGFNPMMLMLMGEGGFGKDGSMKDMLIMQALSGGNNAGGLFGGNNGGFDPMMLMLMGNGEGRGLGSGGGMKDMLIMQALSGGNIFGTPAVAKEPVEATK